MDNGGNRLVSIYMHFFRRFCNGDNKAILNVKYIDMKYLYGASVQGIQNFIFQTDALLEIAGGSELIERICTDMFAGMLGYENPDELSKDDRVIVSAAGNVKYVFGDRESCARVVRNFPKKVLQHAPGVTFSQAVIQVDAEIITPEHLSLLEKTLLTQRNKQIRPLELGMMGMLKARNTGKPVVTIGKDSKRGDLFLDEATNRKRALMWQGHTKSRLAQALFGNAHSVEKLPKEMDEITGKGTNRWIAVLHADGNNFGRIIQKFGRDYAGRREDDFGKAFRSFSQAIDQSTKNAAKHAYMQIAGDYNLDGLIKYPFRPVVIGGDDLTVICRADLALPFTRVFLEKFTEETQNSLGKLSDELFGQGLTACAGIAFIKEKYPFHYGYTLAEDLCRQAKIRSDKRFGNMLHFPAGLMFHRVLDSFIDDFSDIVSRELITNGFNLDFGPYYLNETPGIDELLKAARKLISDEGSAVRTSLRRWLTVAHEDREMAVQVMKRLIDVGDTSIIDLLKLKASEGIVDGKSPVFDWLTICSIINNSNE